MEISTDEYTVKYNPEITTVEFQGVLRLNGMVEYAPIVKLLDEAIAQTPVPLTLDLRSLQFLNSSGINMLSKFILRIRQQERTVLRVKGSAIIPWQGKSLKNFQRLLPNLQLEFE
jgi:hypothetical protein